MSEFRRKVVDVRPVTTEREISRKEKNYTRGASDVTITIVRRTLLHVFLDCGHSRPQRPGDRDITKSKTLECWVCQGLARKDQDEG